MENGNFVAHMEMVLDVYKRPYDARFPVVCMDEGAKAVDRRDKDSDPGAARPRGPVRL